MIIGLTGRIASGKRTFTDYFKKKGFNKYVASDTIKEEAKKRGLEIKRKNLQDIGNLIRKQEGAGALARRIIEKTKSGENFIIKGIRNPAEIEEIRKIKNSYIVAIDAPQELRFKRVLSRKRDIDSSITWEEFLKSDEREYDEGIPSGLRIRECMEMADFTITNDSSLEDFNKKIEEVYNKLKGRLTVKEP